ncbi:hypothetical protein B0A49_08598 [Cryomyces minteri]|uniref:Uncharacterized protein n=1 Tax=Cryomyces minteri TaxID=331657 RepID=A0A4U0WSA4_9PEZI|nr:hypothetical protein B0A49_08598 [Cryomyces minteri]
MFHLISVNPQTKQQQPSEQPVPSSNQQMEPNKPDKPSSGGQQPDPWLPPAPRLPQPGQLQHPFESRLPRLTQSDVRSPSASPDPWLSPAPRLSPPGQLQHPFESRLPRPTQSDVRSSSASPVKRRPDSRRGHKSRGTGSVSPDKTRQASLSISVPPPLSQPAARKHEQPARHPVLEAYPSLEATYRDAHANNGPGRFQVLMRHLEIALLDHARNRDKLREDRKDLDDKQTEFQNELDTARAAKKKLEVLEDAFAKERSAFQKELNAEKKARYRLEGQVEALKDQCEQLRHPLAAQTTLGTANNAELRKVLDEKLAEQTNLITSQGTDFRADLVEQLRRLGDRVAAADTAAMTELREDIAVRADQLTANILESRQQQSITSKPRSSGVGVRQPPSTPDDTAATSSRAVPPASFPATGSPQSNKRRRRDSPDEPMRRTPEGLVKVHDGVNPDHDISECSNSEVRSLFEKAIAYLDGKKGVWTDAAKTPDTSPSGSKKSGPSGPICSHSSSNRKKNNAGLAKESCQDCTNHGRVCIRVERGQPLMIVPLPVDQREGMGPDDIGYWVVQYEQ